MSRTKRKLKRQKIPYTPATKSERLDEAEVAIEYGLPIVVTYSVVDGICTCPLGRRCTSPGKHPHAKVMPNGVKDAVEDFAKLKRLVAPLKEFNLAICTAGITVVDADNWEAVKRVKSLKNYVETAESSTGKGGHFFFDGETKSRTRIAPGIDIKSGANSYVIMALSDHVSGKQYKQKRPLNCMQELPENLLDEIAGKKVRPKRSGTKRVDFRQKVFEGGRNDFLTSRAGRLRRKGLSEDEVSVLLQHFNQKECEPPLDENEVSQIATSVGRYGTVAGSHFRSAADIKAKPINYFLEPYLARGTVAFIEGDPGIGKTYVTLDLASAVSTGRELLGKKIRKGDVLLLSAEDSPEHTIKPRLVALGADVDRIKIMTEFVALNEYGLEVVRTELDEKPADLVVVDPVTAFLGPNIDMYRANEVRAFMVGLKSIADEYSATVVVVRHLTKSSQGNSKLRGLGSIDFQAAVRSVLRVYENPEDPEQRIMVHVKTNFGILGPSQTFELQIQSGKVPTLAWTGTTNVSTDDLDSPKGVRGNPGKPREEAKEFILKKLKNGPMSAQALKIQSEAVGIMPRTLERARSDLGVESFRRNGKFFVRLPE